MFSPEFGWLPWEWPQRPIATLTHLQNALLLRPRWSASADLSWDLKAASHRFDFHYHLHCPCHHLSVAASSSPFSIWWSLSPAVGTTFAPEELGNSTDNGVGTPPIEGRGGASVVSGILCLLSDITILARSWMSMEDLCCRVNSLCRTNPPTSTKPKCTWLPGPHERFTSMLYWPSWARKSLSTRLTCLCTSSSISLWLPMNVSVCACCSSVQ